MADRYSDTERFWKPVDVKMEIAVVVLPDGLGTAGKRRAERRVAV
jgi:hypothetical protein